MLAEHRVADVGCGYGASTILLAQAFPNSRFTGFDFHDVSIARARKAAREHGVADRVEFEVADARAFPGTGYDLVLFVDSLHDMGDPVAVARHAREALAPGGVLVTLDPVAGDSLAENLAIANGRAAVRRFDVPVHPDRPGSAWTARPRCHGRRGCAAHASSATPASPTYSVWEPKRR